jgi:hypothetical protein
MLANKSLGRCLRCFKLILQRSTKTRPVSDTEFLQNCPPKALKALFDHPTTPPLSTLLKMPLMTHLISEMNMNDDMYDMNGKMNDVNYMICHDLT